MNLRLPFRQTNQGFTLIELLVSLSIIALLIGTGIPAFRRFGRVQQLDLAADQVKAAILNARSLALNPRAELNTQAAGTCGDSSTDTLVHHYSVQFAPNSSTYTTLEGTCVIDTGTLTSDIVVQSAPVIISFTLGDGTLSSPGFGLAKIVLISNQLDQNTARSISVNSVSSAVNIAVGS